MGVWRPPCASVRSPPRAGVWRPQHASVRSSPGGSGCGECWEGGGCNLRRGWSAVCGGCVR